MYGAPYYSGYNPYVRHNPYEAAMAEARARRLAEQRERERMAYARALAQERERQAYARAQAQERARAAAAARHNPYSLYDPGYDEEYEYNPYQRRRRDELADAARIQAMYDRAGRSKVDDGVDCNDETVLPAKRQPSHSPKRTTIPINTPSHPQPKAKSPSPRSPTPPPTYSQVQPEHKPALSFEPTEAAHAAASRIQSVWRRHASLRQLADLRKQFDQLAANFVAPEKLEFTVEDARQSTDGLEGIAELATDFLPYASFVRPTSSGGEESKMNGEVEHMVDDAEGERTEEDTKEVAMEDAAEEKVEENEPEDKVPPLAYTSATRKVHAQNEALLRLLNALDSVPSWGDSSVRDARKQLAKDVEGEAARLDAWWRAVWRQKGADAEIKRVRV